ncbi:hypothetical protein [Streptomyces sp. PU-14G]|uniref:hypothetical protein n=1 Tax=Streptomyces sp. PU-14G TaxID=2800808 RepID=UPI0034DF3979
MDLDDVTDELYGLPPDDFTATREQRAQQAREAGARELAGRIHRLRRPTLAAWAGNLLVREQPEQVRLLLELGEALRQAHRDLDGAQLRELSARQHQVTARLAREAAELAAQYGHRISEAARREVADTLHAALADPQAGRDWAAGRLDRPLAPPVGFAPGSAGTAGTGERAGAGGTTTSAGAAPRRRSSKSDRRSSQSDRDRDAGHKAGQDRERRHRQQLSRAREQAREAQRALEAREDEQRAAREAEDRAEERQDQAEQRVTALGEELREAEREQQQARTGVRTARDRLRRAERAVGKARRKADDATARADQLADGS